MHGKLHTISCCYFAWIKTCCCATSCDGTRQDVFTVWHKLSVTENSRDLETGKPTHRISGDAKEQLSARGIRFPFLCGPYHSRAPLDQSSLLHNHFYSSLPQKKICIKPCVPLPAQPSSLLKIPDCIYRQSFIQGVSAWARFSSQVTKQDTSQPLPLRLLVRG